MVPPAYRPALRERLATERGKPTPPWDPTAVKASRLSRRTMALSSLFTNKKGAPRTHGSKTLCGVVLPLLQQQKNEQKLRKTTISAFLKQLV
jgi:hypothetical protein